MRVDEFPVNGIGKERVDVPVVGRPGGPKQGEVLPVTNPRHQLNPQEMGEAKDGGALPLGVRMERLWLDIRGILQETIQNVDRFPDATRDKVTEQRDIGVSSEYV
jgi:hypothetical protein